jgi:hypothetical protein
VAARWRCDDGVMVMGDDGWRWNGGWVPWVRWRKEKRGEN